ncbi:MAG: extracellular solute-binding protein [Acetatifactor sp.]|nr:extracellular solute-binding protein [Acetatifactor sp.]MDE7354164.1 extracellular solute-binding protein [Acetatifactor sp.]
MKRKWIKNLAAITLTMSMALCACGAPEGGDSSGTGTPSAGDSPENTESGTPDTDTQESAGNAVSDISGTVVFAVRDSVMEQTRLYLRDFKQLYPNIQVEIQEFSGSDDLYTYLTNQATAQNMPDVVYGWDNLSTFALQNWIYPLDEFLEKDDEIQYVPQSFLDGFTYEGKVYALPAWLQFSCLAVNKDLCDELNLDVPSYDWSIDEFIQLAKDATTNTTSGINHVGSLEQYLMQEFQGIKGQWGYDSETRTFDLTSGAFEKSVAILDELGKVPQLVADAMRDQSVLDAGGVDDYSKKFGANVDGVSDGKILIINASTWDDEWLNPSLQGVNWDYYPIPAQVKGENRPIVHADYAMMLSTARDPEAAFQLLKYITYGKDGILERMELQNSNANNLYENNRFTIPVSTHPEVAEAFKASENVPEGIKYMYDHLDIAVKGDYSKVLPDYWAVINDSIYQAKVRIGEGEDAASVARETQEKLNESFGASWQIFSEKMQQVQKDFEAMRNQ